MNFASIIGTIGAVVGVANQALAVGRDVKPFVDIIWNDIVGRDPQTEAEVAAVVATVDGKIAELRARLHLPLPPAQADDV